MVQLLFDAGTRRNASARPRISIRYFEPAEGYLTYELVDIAGSIYRRGAWWRNRVSCAALAEWEASAMRRDEP